MRLVPIGGLGNRLRMILSYRAVHFGDLEVLWARSPAVCGGRWEDAFEPLVGCTFTDIGTGHAHDYTGPHDAMWGPQVYERAPATWTHAYAELAPAGSVRGSVNYLQDTLELRDGYVAVHARRGDHVTHSAQFGHHTSSEELLRWADLSRWPLYLASDDPVTVTWFAGRLRALMWHRIPEHVAGYEQRPGTLADAVVDMWMCRGAADFRGSWMSSFSETIDLLRCHGRPEGGFVGRQHMPSADAEWYRGRPDRAQERIARGFA